MRLYRFSQISFFILILTVISFHPVMAYSPATPWSQIISSSNGKYNLVLISPKVKEQEEYIFRSREFWRKGGIPAENVPEAEKSLQKEIDLEASIRRKYPESGLYTTEKSPKLLWNTDLYDLKSVVKVSNDGKHFVAKKWSVTGITEEKPLEYNPEVKEVVRIYPNLEEIILVFYYYGKIICSYKVLDLVRDSENLQRTSSNDFMWSDEGVLNDKTNSFSLTKLNGKVLTFDIANGNLLSESQNEFISKSKYETSPNSEIFKYFFYGAVLIAGLLFSIYLYNRSFRN